MTKSLIHIYLKSEIYESESWMHRKDGLFCYFKDATSHKKAIPHKIMISALLRLRFLVFQLNILLWGQIIISFLRKMQPPTNRATGFSTQLGSFLKLMLKNYRTRAVLVKEKGRFLQLQDLLLKSRHEFSYFCFI